MSRVPAPADVAAAGPPRLPAVDRVLGWPGLATAIAQSGRAPVLAAVRAELAACRADGLRPDVDALQSAILARVAAAGQAHQIGRASCRERVCT